MGERVLRDAVTVSARPARVAVSVGTAAVLGLQRVRQSDAPTTAYLMIGGRCSHDCAFCAQARRSAASSRWLSRVAWPQHPLEQTVDAVKRSFEQGRIQRCCLQVTDSPGYLARTLEVVRNLHGSSGVPVCASIALSDLESVRILLDSGAERVSMALDAASDRVFRASRGGDWQRHVDLLAVAAQRFPGRIATHLIAGLGETEQEMALMLQALVDRQITVGLFSFTPVRGTAWADREPPSLSSYRRVQAALHLLRSGASCVRDWSFSAAGEVASYGLSGARLAELLGDGAAFRTAGCPGCNRPYYNERPGGVPYNFPRPLLPIELKGAVALVELTVK